MWWNLDLALRFLYVLAAPLALIPLTALVPLTGVLVGVGIATVVALAGSDRWRARVSRIPVLGGPLANMANLGDYYAEHHPRPLVYYVLYPLLAPYWLFVRDARREFLLYRRINGIAFVLIVVLGAVDYIKHWRPEIPFAAFFTNSIAALIIQLIVTMCLVMPIVTTIVLFHQRQRRKTLYALLALAVIVSTVMAVVTIRIDRPTPSAMTRTLYRARANPAHSIELLKSALDAAVAAPADDDATVAAQRVLAALWKPDEARIFRVHRSPAIVMIYANLGRKPTIWIARDSSGHYVMKAAQLPPDARAKLRVTVSASRE